LLNLGFITLYGGHYNIESNYDIQKLPNSRILSVLGPVLVLLLIGGMILFECRNSKANSETLGA
tara:strand:+ start:308 stop:499 length:192 start_codon:yes stop_codon:yes gene_type:complete